MCQQTTPVYPTSGRLPYFLTSSLLFVIPHHYSSPYLYIPAPYLPFSSLYIEFVNGTSLVGKIMNSFLS